MLKSFSALNKLLIQDRQHQVQSPVRGGADQGLNWLLHRLAIGALNKMFHVSEPQLLHL